MATTASEKTGQLTRRQIVRLAAVISADNMAAIADGYMDISDETIKNKKYENKDNAEAFNREILNYWSYKNSEDDQVYVSDKFENLQQIKIFSKFTER